MKAMKKVVAILLTVAYCLGLMTFGVLAASVEQDGLKVVLTTDKSEYSDGDKISALLVITNQNDTAVTGISVQTLLPDGYQLADKNGKDQKLEDLQAGASVTIDIELLPVSHNESDKNEAVTMSNPTKTGDDTEVSGLVLCLLFSGILIVTILAIKKKCARKLLSIIICMAMIGSTVSTTAREVSAAENKKKTVVVTESVKVRGEDAAVTVTVTYEVKASSANLTDGYDEEKQILSKEVAKLYGIDSEKEDFDNDGLNNYIEIYVTGTDPALADSDKDGINDADEDYDGDGITNIEEVQIGTDLDKIDSDKDDISDYEEINIYNTNPCDYDTDDDSLSDGDEVVLGLNPLIQKTDGITPDSEREFVQELSEENVSESLLKNDNMAKPSLTLKASGNINKNVLVNQINSESFSDSRAVLGEAINISGDAISEGNLTFSLNDDSISLLSFEDTYNTNIICKYNSNGTTEFLDTSYDAVNHTISADIQDKGTYFVMNVENLFHELGLELPATADVSEENMIMGTASKAMAQADIIFVIDSTNSMGNEIENVKENIGYFVDALKQKGVSAGLALIDYQDITVDGYDSTKVHKNDASNWFYDMDAYKETLGELTLGFGGDGPECAVDALETARLLDMRASAGKIFVLVTDADYKVDNRYSIPSMDAEIELLQNAGVSCSVVSPSYEQSTYADLYTQTDGLGMDIYGDFYIELMTLADKIGDDIVGDGYWIYLNGPVPVPVRLDAEPKEGSNVDTDKDGIPDIEELGGAVPTGMIDLDALLTQVSQGVITGTNYGSVMMYEYISNPGETDTDFDGTDDSVDALPNNNQGKGIMHYSVDEASYTCDIEFAMDYRHLIDGNNERYTQDLSMLSILYATDVYDTSYIEITEFAQTGGNDDPTTFGTLLGMSDSQYINIVAEEYETDKDDTTDFYVGHRNMVYNGEEHEVIVVSIRGTNGTNEEWSSNFDIGAETNGYYIAAGYSHPDWLNRENHKGFDVAANRVLKKLNAYIEEYVDSDAKKNILITGHSRGAAIANILGKHFEDDPAYNSYTYTFATPNTTTASNAASYKTIFNVLNTDDIITFIPLESWGFSKFGVSKAVCVEDYYENEFGAEEEGCWEWFIGQDYNNDSNTQNTLSAFAKIINNRDELYVWGSTDAEKVWEDDLGHITRAGAEEELAELMTTLENEKLLRFCNMYIVYSLFVYHVEINYCPAYLLQTLANMTTGVGPLLGRDVAGKYASAKTAFVASSGKVVIGGMTHPHMPPTYYIMAYHDLESLY